MNTAPILPYSIAVIPVVLKAFVGPEKRPSAKTVIAAFLYGALVWGLYDVNKSLGTAFAWTGATTSFLINGIPAIQTVTKGL